MAKRAQRRGTAEDEEGAAEPGECSAAGNAAAEKLRSSSLSFYITYLQYHVLWEQTTVCIRRPQRERERRREKERVSVKGAQGGPSGK